MATAEEVMKQLQEKLANTFRDLPAIIGEEAVAFTQENFDAQGWQGDSFEPWQKRLNPNAWGQKDDPTRAILIKTSKLRRSIRVSRIVEDAVYIQAGGADIPYARAHNEGFSGTVNQNVGEHLRKGKKGETIKVSAFKRTIQQNIPKRKFIGGQLESSQLRSRIKNTILQELKKTL
ncbi:MAG: hypothetical protein LC112_07720 [Flavobacteriales bacterium]|nr:hypothetical protein [Flavobacteriales bacterium]